MSWVRVDDQFFRHPKAREVGKDGRALFVAGLCYCAGHLTDGRIDKTAVALIAAEAEVPPRTAARLVQAGFWHDQADHFEVHDYLEYNLSRADVEGKRDAAYARVTANRDRTEVDVRANNPADGLPPKPKPPSKEQRATEFGEDFESLWLGYPRKLAKQDAFKAYQARRRDGICHEDLALAVKHYAEVCERDRTEPKFVLHGATFFGPRERWKDYLEPPVPGEVEPGELAW